MTLTVGVREKISSNGQMTSCCRCSMALCASLGAMYEITKKREIYVTGSEFIVIDNIFTNNFNINDIFQWDTNSRYHWSLYPVRHHLINNDKNDNGNEYKIVRIFNESRINQFTGKLKNTGWSLLNLCRECQTYFSKFCTLIKTIYLSMVEHSHSLQLLKCDIEIAFPGWRIG